ncbi:hypothetical protein LTR10_001974 [Elasticomyces elasticus]|nr:hypothetical protein LTR10_001974 [Elasticomyces elasticus]KAK4969188.1 hypothetical protein LTR42_009467 [Elasticomyces elasticus]
MSRRLSDSSYYDFDGAEAVKGNPDSTWMLARDVRAQQQAVPPWSANDGTYPSHYMDARNKLSNCGPGPLIHHPINYGTQKPWKPGDRQGALRSVYTPGDTAVFDLVCHDRRAGTTASGVADFEKAEYRGARARK